MAAEKLLTAEQNSIRFGPHIATDDIATREDEVSNIGFIDNDAAAAMGGPAGPIRLLNGIPGPRGFGALHIETTPGRMKQIKGLGYSGVMAFVSDIAKNWTRIARGKDGKFILVYPKDGYDLRIILSLDVTGNGGSPFWSITTAIPSRVERSPVIFER